MVSGRPCTVGLVRSITAIDFDSSQFAPLTDDHLFEYESPWSQPGVVGPVLAGHPIQISGNNVNAEQRGSNTGCVGDLDPH